MRVAFAVLASGDVDSFLETTRNSRNVDVHGVELPVSLEYATGIVGRIEGRRATDVPYALHLRVLDSTDVAATVRFMLQWARRPGSTQEELVRSGGVTDQVTLHCGQQYVRIVEAAGGDCSFAVIVRVPRILWRYAPHPPFEEPAKT